MIGCIVLALLIVSAQAAQQTQPSPAPAPVQVQAASPPEPPPALSKTLALSRVRRIYVESFGADPISQQMQAMVITSLTNTDRYTVTEDKDKADAVLKGVATQMTSQELHAYGSGTAVGTAHGGGHAEVNGSGGTFSGTAGSGFGAAQAATQDSSVNTETIDSAHAAVRLVNKDGDVIWTTTQESTGAKFKGASADVADKIAKQLVRDAEKADEAAAAHSGSK